MSLQGFSEIAWALVTLGYGETSVISPGETLGAQRGTTAPTCRWRNEKPYGLDAHVAASTGQPFGSVVYFFRMVDWSILWGSFLQSGNDFRGNW